MRDVDRLYEFVWLPTFEHTAKGVLTEGDRQELESRLLENPEVGPVLPRTGGFRKVRYALQGRGKSGGVRVIYFFDESCGRLYMMLVYPKNGRASLTAAEEKELYRLAKLVRGEKC